MAAVKLILFLMFGAISFALADSNGNELYFKFVRNDISILNCSLGNLTVLFDDQWKALEALRQRYPYSTFELSVEIEPNTLPPAPAPFPIKFGSKIEKVPEEPKIPETAKSPKTTKAPESSKAPETTKAPKKPTTKKPKKIQPKSKNAPKEAKN
uniref:Uncharacterized protein n=1 Tax=Panagrolaimus davidi TaxID=227884 RepID=A0A914PTE0_9BILA